MGQWGRMGVWRAAWGQGHRDILPVWSQPVQVCGFAGLNGWQGLREAERLGEHLWCVSMGSSMHPMRGQTSLSLLGICPCVSYSCTGMPISFLLKLHWCKTFPESQGNTGPLVPFPPDFFLFFFLRMKESRQTFLNLFFILWLLVLLKTASSSPPPHGKDPRPPSLPFGLYKGHTCVGMYPVFFGLPD